MDYSKTYQYRKVMKPILERKRRARINKCLDELKDIIVSTLESEGEHIIRLEKADILELTVQHFQKIREKRSCTKQNSNPTFSQADGFRSGFIFAANEVSKNLARISHITFATQLMSHLGKHLNKIQPPIQAPIPIHYQITVQCSTFNESKSSSVASSSPVSSNADNYSPIVNYTDILTSNCLLMKHPQPLNLIQRYELNEEENVWRPW